MKAKTSPPASQRMAVRRSVGSPWPPVQGTIGSVFHARAGAESSDLEPGRAANGLAGALSSDSYAVSPWADRAALVQAWRRDRIERPHAALVIGWVGLVVATRLRTRGSVCLPFVAALAAANRSRVSDRVPRLRENVTRVTSAPRQAAMPNKFG